MKINVLPPISPRIQLVIPRANLTEACGPLMGMQNMPAQNYYTMTLEEAEELVAQLQQRIKEARSQ